jgi:curved DNA-binding protein CbpA
MNNEPTYYETLNVSSEASALGIVQAYREIKLIFQPNNLATYSLYSDEELTIMNERIEEAYVILSNSETRRTYDEQFGPSESLSKRGGNKVQQPQPKKDKKKEGMPLVKSIPLPKLLHGKALKKIRKSQGITLAQIADKTNIPKAYLKAIESEDLSVFPGTFYLKSYLKQYASSMGLNPQQTWEAYKAYVKD